MTLMSPHRAGSALQTDRNFQTLRRGWLRCAGEFSTRGVFAIALGLCLPAALVCAPVETVSPQPHGACGVQPPGGKWADAAQWIAGMSDTAFSSALSPEQHAAWGNFAKLSNTDWAKLRKQYLDHIDAWRSHNLGNAPSRETAFYPFGGPDAANLLEFYPDAHDYILLGLEPVGCIPATVAGYPPEYFAELRRSLSSVVSNFLSPRICAAT